MPSAEFFLPSFTGRTCSGQCWYHHLALWFLSQSEWFWYSHFANELFGIICVLIADNPYKCHLNPCGLYPLCCSSIFTALVVLDLSVQCKFFDCAKLHQTTLPGLNFCIKEKSTSLFKAPSSFQSDWWCPVLTQFFFFLFFSSQPPRLIPVSCRNFFRRLQPTSSELTPMVRKMRGFPLFSVLPCWWFLCMGTAPGSSPCQGANINAAFLLLHLTSSSTCPIHSSL